METDTQYLAIMTTVGSEPDAERLAKGIVEKKLAACVQTHPIHSVYRWQGKICREPEILLTIKTAAAKYTQLEEYIRSNHPYQTPEIVAIPVANGSADYLRWIDSNLED